MNNNTKSGRLGGVFYLICVLMLLAILTSAIMSALGNSRKKETVKQDPEANTVEPAEKGQNSETTGIIEKKSGSVFKEDNDVPPASSEQPQTQTETEKAGNVSGLPTEFTLPISGTVLKQFNGDVPVYSQTMNDYRTHLGIDLQGKPGTQVKAFADGEIDAIYNDEFMGNVMVINHGGGMKSYYMNIGDTYPQGIEQGATVTCGQTVAGVGQGAKLEALDESHLHFEVSLNGERVDPLGYIDHATLSDTGFEGSEE